MYVNQHSVFGEKQELKDDLISFFTLNQITQTAIIYEILDDVLYTLNESTSITITNSEGEFLYANDIFCELSQYSRKEMIHQNCRLVHGNVYPTEFFQNMRQQLLAGYTWRGEIPNLKKDGTLFGMIATVVPFKDEKREQTYFLSFQIDVTEKKQSEVQFKTNFVHALQSLQNGIFKVRKESDGQMYYTMSEGRLMERLGASTSVISGKSPLEVFDPSVATIKNEYYTKAFDGERVHYELELNGTLIYVDIEPIKQNGKTIELVGTVYDFSEFRDAQKQLKAHKERHQSLINYSHEYIITLDKHNVITDMNPKTAQLLAVSNHLFGKIKINDVAFMKDYGELLHYLKKAQCGEVQFFEFESKVQDKIIILNVTLVPILVDEEIEGIYIIGFDITEEKLVQKRNAYLAHHDELTGLPNRRWMEKSIQELLVKPFDAGQQIAILSIDLDRFKTINDTLGHFVGDELLQQIADRLNKYVMTEKNYVARMGGDEFMMLCPNTRSIEDVKAIAQLLLKSLEKPFYIQEYELLITASIGIILTDLQHANVTELMKQVDIALYKSKEFGRNMYQVYDDSMNRENYQQFILERDLRKAVMDEEFIPYLQPKVDARTGEVVGAEALIRWQHPERGLISPGEFIPIAEETGLIIPIGRWMKKQVCEQLVKWRKEGIPLIPISVNITAQRLLQQTFAQEIQQVLEEYQLDGKWLEIEITENSIMRNEETVQKTLKALKEMGVKVFIDDFGTGYSSFNYLKTFEIDGVKIDRSFIHNIKEKPENASITSAMIKMAQYLQLEVIAEGVETQEELDFLLQENCHFIQGFFYGKPCPITQFEQQFLEDKIK